MKISFPKYGPGELLTRKQAATRTVSFVAIVFFAGVCGSYLLGNKWWLLTIAALVIAGILLCLGAAAAISLK
jgi:divalent metal cation (Fe/Co/Zn/Cd) transporter